MSAPKERTWDVPPLAEGDPSVAAPLLAIVSEPGWSVEATKTWHGTAALRFTGASKGRGTKRPTFLVVGSETSDHADLFAMLAGLLRDRVVSS